MLPLTDVLGREPASYQQADNKFICNSRQRKVAYPVPLVDSSKDGAGFCAVGDAGGCQFSSRPFSGGPGVVTSDSRTARDDGKRTMKSLDDSVVEANVTG